MAMLAGPRRKQKVINLRAKNSEWSNDTNKFGQRMLEKMGWSSGKGLGAREHGMVEHVVARYKNDERGLGFEDRNDQWTKHEDDFNALLSNLSNGDNKQEKLHSGVSLEVKSKKSKARVHYHKFTRGKDLTRYSEKDLANIFGKKSLKNEEKPEEVQIEDITSTEQVFTEKGSMADYFKNKLAAIQSKKQISVNFCNVKEDNDVDYSFRGFSGTANGDTQAESQDDVAFQGFSFNSTSNEQNDEHINEVPLDFETKKSKKKKKSKKHCEEQVDHENEHEIPVHNSDENSAMHEPVKKKKSKKEKKEKETETETTSEEIKKSKKKSKIDSSPIDDVNEEENYVPKKKKKRKNKKNDL